MEINQLKTAFEIIPIEVASTANETKETATYRTDKDNVRVLGVALSIGNTTALAGSKIGIKINGEEVTPKDFEAKFLYVTDGAVSPNERFYYFGPIDINESEVDIRWVDGGSLPPLDYSDNIYLYLLCEKKS